jgi:hypothetical protein
MTFAESGSEPTERGFVMKSIGGVILVALAVGVASAASAQTRAPEVSGTERTAPMLPNEIAPPVSKSPPVLFWIGSLPVRLWAPVEPSYDATADRTAADNPSWGTP